MSMIMAEVYDEFLSAGTPEYKARKAAEALANHDSSFIKIETDVAVIKWMCGTILAAVVAILLKTFF